MTTPATPRKQCPPWRLLQKRAIVGGVAVLVLVGVFGFLRASRHRDEVLTRGTVQHFYWQVKDQRGSSVLERFGRPEKRVSRNNVPGAREYLWEFECIDGSVILDIRQGRVVEVIPHENDEWRDDD